MQVGCQVISLCAFYRSPSSGAEPISLLFRQMLSIKNNCVIVSGDFNLPHIEWSVVPKAHSNLIEYREFFTLCEVFSLTQYIRVPTRKDAILDLLLCNEEHVVTGMHVVPGIGDHDCVVASVLCPKPLINTRCERKVYFFERANFSGIASVIEQYLTTVKVANYAACVDRLWSNFKAIILDAIDCYIPSKIVTSKRRCDKPYINAEIKRLIKRKSRLYSKFRATGDPEIGNKLRCASVALKYGIEEAKNRYFCSLNDRIGHSKDLWKHIRCFTKTKVGIPSIQDGVGVVDDDLAKADLFNGYFATVFASTRSPFVPAYQIDVAEGMPPIMLSIDGIRKLIECLDVKKSCGPDGISGHVLRGCSEVISRFLHLLYEASLTISVLPKDWKIANITPIFKTGDKCRVGNYRPVSLLCISSKLLEHIIYSNIVKHLDRNNFFHHTSMAFEPDARV